MRDLTRRQEEILNLIRECIETTGLPPTRVEIAQHFGFSSPNAAGQHLKVLAKKGALDLLPENPDFEPIVVDLKRQKLVIEGIAVGVIRNETSL
jgi:SOS-response transcriptional repressor LexA